LAERPKSKPRSISTTVGSARSSTEPLKLLASPRLEKLARHQAFHDAGVANGGKSIEDPPGWREVAAGKVYLAYLRDPSGNKIVAVHRG